MVLIMIYAYLLARKSCSIPWGKSAATLTRCFCWDGGGTGDCIGEGGVSGMILTGGFSSSPVRMTGDWGMLALLPRFSR